MGDPEDENVSYSIDSNVYNSRLQFRGLNKFQNDNRNQTNKKSVKSQESGEFELIQMADKQFLEIKDYQKQKSNQ